MSKLLIMKNKAIKTITIIVLASLLIVGGGRYDQGVLIKGPSGNQAEVNSNNQLHVVLMGKVDTGNSTATPLTSGSVFTGTAFNTLDFGFIFITVFSDVASATDGLSFQQSSDGTNWDVTDVFNYIANSGKPYSIQPAAKWFRVVYTNGGTNQAAFRLQVIFKKTSSLASSHRLSDNLSVEDDATLGISVIKGQKPNADYTDFQATTSGNFKVSVEEIQNKISTNNSTTSVLSEDAVYTGTADDVSNFANVTIQLDSSHDSAVDGMTFQFSTDNTNWDDVYTFTYTAAEGARRFQFPATAQYFRVVYTNGSTLQTHFRVQTILHVSDILTSIHRLQNNTSPDRSVELVKSAIIASHDNILDYKPVESTSGGHLKVSLESKTAFGDIRTAELSPQFQGSFEYTVDNTDLTEKTVVNGGTVTQASGMGVVTTSTTTASTARLNSVRHARYKSGLGGLIRFTALFTSPIAATEQYVGLADETGSSAAFENGYMIGYDGTTFGYHRFQNDVKTTTAIALWDDPLDGFGESGETIDQTKLNIFFIQYQYLGAGAIKIFFEEQDGDMILVHTDEYAGLNTEPSTHNPNFHFMMFVNNKATTDNLIVKSSSYAYFVEGRTAFIELHQPQNATELIEKLTVSTEVAILTIRNKALYASKTNFIDIHIQNIAVAIEAANANNLGDIRVVKNTTLGGTPSYADINTANSVVEIDVAGTTLTGGVNILPIPMAGKNDKDNFDVNNKRIILGPGETLTISGTNTSGTATFRGSIQWRELF